MLEGRSLGEESGIFGMLVGAMARSRGGVDIFPADDAEDLTRGVQSIPDEVTDARRAGQKVIFVQDGPPSTWYWRMPDGSHVQ